MDPVPRQVDVVVIGAGPAGAEVARRLADDGRRVVLVEGGSGGPRPASVVGLDLVAASDEATRHWPGLMVCDRPDGPMRPYRQGRGLGGGSMINGMLLTPGDRVDYQRWAGEWGCRSWGPDDLAPWLERVMVSAPTQRLEPGPVSAALGQAAVDDGLERGGNSLEADRLGVLGAELSAVDGRRWSAADAHLGGDGDQPEGVHRSSDGSLTIITGRPVDRLGAAQRSGTHEVVLVGGASIRAALVVVAAGALATPALLLRSGLTGRPVGATLSDHPSYAFTLVLRDDRGLRDQLMACPPVVSTLVRWSSGPDWPGDLQAIAIDRVNPIGFDGPSLAVVAVGLMAVTSRGSVTVPDPGGWGGPAPGAAGVGTGVDGGVDVVTGLLGAADDRRRLREGVRRVARWLRSAPFDDLVEEIHLDERGRPGEEIDGLSDGELDRVLASRPGPYAHPAGTCPLGPDGALHAVTAIEPGRMGEILDRPGIRVADASVFPDLIRGGLQLPVAAVAARIADDIVSGG